MTPGMLMKMTKINIWIMLMVPSKMILYLLVVKIMLLELKMKKILVGKEEV